MKNAIETYNTSIASLISDLEKRSDAYGDYGWEERRTAYFHLVGVITVQTKIRNALEETEGASDRTQTLKKFVAKEFEEPSVNFFAGAYEDELDKERLIRSGYEKALELFESTVLV